jgi:hypothetical protein
MRGHKSDMRVAEKLINATLAPRACYVSGAILNIGGATDF